MTSYAQLLGVPQLRVGDIWHDLPLTKAGALLCYLAYTGEWASRDQLLYLFYPDTAEQPARANLRQRLTSLRKLPYARGLEIEDTKLRWSIETDVAQFKQAVAKEKWTTALELYRGELLHGFQVHDLSEFDNWLSLERQELHTMWRRATLTFAEELAATERAALAADVLAPLHKADVFDEDVLRVYLEQLYSCGQKTRALETFEAFRKTIHHELGSEPDKRTLELITAIQHDEPLHATSSVAVKTRAKEAKPHHNLPLQTTDFIGRQTEKAKLAAILANPKCRLLTIVAPGGMGKTRLAIEVAASHVESFQKVCLVSFAALASVDLMVYALADALELTLFGAKSPKEQVLDYLTNKKMLLVLDNLEHLLSGVDLISDILASTPETKILATSRERLQLQAEHVFDLEGLAVPDEKSSDAKAFDSLQLFAERAKPNRLEFALEQHRRAVTRICQLVGGMPLAIELAASWSRLLTPNEIVQELEHSLDLLSTSTRDLPERHHSMRGVFEASWQRLSDNEQTALQKLSVFQGGFTREAAHAVAKLDLPLLLSLVNKSFVWRDVSGRFSQHPLILQYLQQKAKDYPEEKKQVEEKHGLYYLELVKERVPELRTQQARETREALDNELPNIRAAWNWTLREKRVEEIPRCAQALRDLFRLKRNEGVGMFKQAVAILDEKNPEHHAALGYALIHQALLDGYLGNLDSSSIVKLIEKGLALLVPLDEYSGILWGYTTLGAIAWNLGDFTKTKEVVMAALSLARRFGNSSEIGRNLTSLCDVERNLGNFSEVSVLMRSSLEELRELGDLVNLSVGLTMFGSYLVDNNKLEEGENLLQESLELGQKYHAWTVPTLADLARLAYKRRDFQRAEAFAHEAYEAASEHTGLFMKATTLTILGRVKLAQGHLGEAEQLIVESLKLGWNANRYLALSHSLVFLAELNIAQGHVKQGVTLLNFVIHYSAMEKRDREEALKLLETARQQLSARAFSQAQEESTSLTLEGIVTEILEHGVS